MAKIETLPKIQIEIRLILTEEEAAALSAIAGYGIDAFLEVFYDKMGKSYLQPHEEGLRSLFESAYGNIPPIMRQSEKARKTFYGENK